MRTSRRRSLVGASHRRGASGARRGVLARLHHRVSHGQARQRHHELRPPEQPRRVCRARAVRRKTVPPPSPPSVRSSRATCWNSGRTRATSPIRSMPCRDSTRRATCAFSADRAVGKGDRVFRVRSAEAAFEDDLFEPRVAVTGRAVLRIGQPLRVEFSLAESAAYSEAAAATVGAAEGDVVEAARTKAVAEDDVRAHIDRLGQTPFELVALDVELDEGVGIGFSQLHRVRAAALDDLSEQLLAPTRNRALPRVQERVLPAPARPRGVRGRRVGYESRLCPRREARRCRHHLRARAQQQARRSRRGRPALVDRRASGLPEAGRLGVAHRRARPGARHARGGARLRRLALRQARQAGARGEPGRPRASRRARGRGRAGPARSRHERAVACTPPPSSARSAYGSRLSSRWDRSPTWPRDSPVELGLTIMGAQELMVTEHCLLMSQGPCDERL